MVRLSPARRRIRVPIHQRIQRPVDAQDSPGHRRKNSGDVRCERRLTQEFQLERGHRPAWWYSMRFVKSHAVTVLAWMCCTLAASTGLSVRAYLGASGRVRQLDTYYHSRFAALADELGKFKGQISEQSSYCRALCQDTTVGYSSDESADVTKHLDDLAQSVDSLREFAVATPSADSIIKAFEVYDASPSVRLGAVCSDGWVSGATGRGACSHHGGVASWTYGKASSPPSPTEGLSSVTFPQASVLSGIRALHQGRGPLLVRTAEPDPNVAVSEPSRNEFQDLIPKREEQPSSPPATSTATFYIGSSEADVLRIMGTPSSRDVYGSTTMLRYDLSSISINEGRVSEYDNTSKNLLVRAPGALSRSQEHFTVGSAESDVIATMGTPSSRDVYGSTVMLRYGLSSVSVIAGRVTEYENTDHNLKVKE